MKSKIKVTKRSSKPVAQKATLKNSTGGKNKFSLGKIVPATSIIKKTKIVY